ncbi:MAG: hypothetical protein JJU12_03865 [Chlamydiales bacterium]|nr:hypothetical protein [Chlamydiales bacterium]
MLTDKTLAEKNRRGLIHAPDESDDAYLLRCKEAKKRDSSPRSELAAALFDIEPDWVHLRYSDQRLRLWEGGCTWIEDNQVVLQLRKAFEKKSRYLGYSREEIIAHELVHVVRGSFEEPIFEEIIAYQSSPSRLRRFLGPIFRSSRESVFFILSLCAACFATLLATFQTVVYLGAFGVVAGGTFRLIKAQRTFSSTRKIIGEIVGKEKALAVMIRLTDREIIRFSKMEKEQIIRYSVKMSRTQTRWRQICLAYFPS